MKDKNKAISEKNVLATKEDMYQLEVKMSEMKTEFIKWMFIFWKGQIVVTLGIVYFRAQKKYLNTIEIPAAMWGFFMLSCHCGRNAVKRCNPQQ